MDALIAIMFVLLFAVGAFMYFRGARRQLDECVRHRKSGQWMSDREWRKTVDISTIRKFPRMR